MEVIRLTLGWLVLVNDHLAFELSRIEAFSPSNSRADKRETIYLVNPSTWITSFLYHVRRGVLMTQITQLLSFSAASMELLEVDKSYEQGIKQEL